MQHIQTHKGGGEGTVRHYVEQLVVGFEWKIAFSIVGAFISTFGHFYGSIMWGFLGLFCLDLVSGIMKSKLQDIPISSKRLRASVTKLAAYMTLITALIITSKFEASFVPVVTVTYYYFIFTELTSIVENVEEMGVKVPSFLKGKIRFKTEEYDKDADRNSQQDKKDTNK